MAQEECQTSRDLITVSYRMLIAQPAQRQHRRQRVEHLA